MALHGLGYVRDSDESNFEYNYTTSSAAHREEAVWVDS